MDRREASMPAHADVPVVLSLGRVATATAVAARVKSPQVEVLVVPTITVQHADPTDLDEALDEAAVGELAGLCFTSAATVDAVTRSCRRTGREGAALQRAGLIGAVGPATAEHLHGRLGLRADVVPRIATGRALGRAFPPGRGTVLLPCSDLASGELAHALGRRGYACRRIEAYRTRPARTLPPRVHDALDSQRVVLVSATSPSAVRGWVQLAGRITRDLPVVAIGPITAAACRRLDLPVARVAEPHDAGGVAAAIDGCMRAC